MSAITSSALSESSAPVGSSAQTTRGWPASARAIVTRCCSPPESSLGRCAVRWPRPTRSSVSIAVPTRLRRSDAGEEQRDLDVLHRTEHRDQVELLEHEAHRRRAPVRAGSVTELVERLAVEDDPTTVDVVEPRQAVQQRRLSRAYGPITATTRPRRPRGTRHAVQRPHPRRCDRFCGHFTLEQGVSITRRCRRGWCCVVASPGVGPCTQVWTRRAPEHQGKEVPTAGLLAGRAVDGPRCSHARPLFDPVRRRAGQRGVL